MRILVVGGTGFIGRYIVRQLASRDHHVVLLHRGNNATNLPASVEHILAPHSAMPVVEYPLPALRLEPEVVIHTIAMGEADAAAAVRAFSSIARRMVMLSSGDVYRAYGCFRRLERDCQQPDGLLTEGSPLRTSLYPYRSHAPSPDSWQHSYEKILAEQIVLASSEIQGVVLRLPKVYGPEQNSDLATVYRYREHPDWRWTHGYVENVAAAVVTGVEHPAASGRIYNVGEEHTPTVSDRLEWLPPSELAPDRNGEFDFAFDIAYDTARIRSELGYRELVPEAEAMLRTLDAKTRRAP